MSGTESAVVSIGVTGTRHGATNAQLDTLRQTIIDITHNSMATNRPTLELHHGDCRGVDAQVAGMAAGLAWELVAHPPDNDKFRAWVPSHTTMKPLPYLTRDRNIVSACSMLLAAPNRTFNFRAPYERGEGGTIYTVKHAVTRGRPIRIVWPTGEVEKVDWWST